MPSRTATRRFFLYGLLLLAALVSALLGGTYLLANSDYLRDRLSQGGSDAMGREFVIAGPLNIRWDWGRTRVHAEDVRITNAPGLEDPYMLDIPVLDFTVKPLKLLLGRLELPEVSLQQPRLVLVRDADGNKNWDMPALSEGGVATEAVVPDDRGDFPVIGVLKVTDGAIVYRDAVKDLDIDLKLSTLTGDGGDAKDGFELSGSGTLSGKDFTLDATGGSLLDLRNADKDYPLSFDIVMGATRAQGDGTFKDPLKMTGVDTQLNLKGPNLADLFYITGIPFPPTPVYALSGRLKKDGDVWSFDIPDGKIGNSDVRADGSYDVGGDRGFLKMDIASKVMHLDDLGGFVGLTPRGNETVAPSDRLFPAVPINLERLRNADLDVRLKADRLVAEGWPFESLDLRFNLDKGLLRIDPANAGIAGGQMSGTITVDGSAGKQIPHVETDIMLRKLSMKEFFADTRFESLSSGRFGGRFRVNGDGASLAQALGNSDGRISVGMAGGQISLLLIEAAGLDIAEFTARLLGEDKTTRVRCGIGDFGVKNGLLTSDIFVFDTTDTNIEGDATINLKTETIDATVEAHPKDPSPLAARTPLRITGPLKKPNVGLRPDGLALRGAGAAALSLINPLAAIIPFLEPGGGEDTPCRDLISTVRARYDGNIAVPTEAETPR